MRTKLQGVQEVMRRMGKHPADALDTGGASVEAHIERVMDDASLSVQSEGWYWNTKYDVEVSPDGDDGDKIKVSELEGVSVAVFHVDTHGDDADKDVVRKGDYLYDLDENTDAFSSSIKIRYSFERAFSEVPDSFQKWIIALAGFNFNRYYVGSQNADSALQIEIGDSRRQATREEIRARDVNVLNTQEMQHIRGRRTTPDRSVY